MSDAQETVDAQTQRKIARRVLWYLVGGFGIVIAANAVLAAFAVTSWSGLETEHAYDRGLRYNDVLAVAEAQAARGWSAALTHNTGHLSVLLKDRDGRGVTSQTVAATFVRPTSAGLDQTVTLQAEGAGHYGADIELPLLGNWDVRIRAEGSDGVWITSQRIWAK